MIKILIVDDDSSKISNIIKIITQNTNIDVETIDYVLDTVNARKKLSENIYDLLILDMILPTTIDGDPKKDGGIELLERIHTKQITNYPHHIIGITGFKEIFNDEQINLEKYLWTLIHYDNSSNDWENQIISKINYLIETKQNNYGTCFKKYDIAIITAVEEVELKAILQLPYNWKEFTVPNDPTTNYYEGSIQVEEKTYSIVAACSPKMGMVPSAILTTKMCMHFHPTYFFMGGIAAGIKDRSNFGDILVSEFSWDWGSGKITADFKPDHTQIAMDPSIIAKLKQIKATSGSLRAIKDAYPGVTPNTELDMFIGPIASGASVLENIETIDEIKKYQRKIIGIEMEIYGVLSAIKYSIKPEPIAICLKSVCDFGDEDKNDDWQYYAAYTSSKMIDLLIKKLDI